jgi:DNA-binding response OmpR family regulator
MENRNAKKIFVIDDEADIRDIIEINLSREGYKVQVFPSAEDALLALKQDNPDLIILDIMMSGMDGYDFCKHLRAGREHAGIPIIFLSAKSDEFDKVLGLELGGDDYITKPFSLKELLSRVKSVLRRMKKPAETAADMEVLQFEGIEMNPDRFQVTVDGADVRFTKTEFELLYLFMRYPGKVFSRDNIINSIRGDDIYIIDRTIDVHIMNIRKKLGPYKNIISTFSGVGYGIKV